MHTEGDWGDAVKKNLSSIRLVEEVLSSSRKTSERRKEEEEVEQEEENEDSNESEVGFVSWHTQDDDIFNYISHVQNNETDSNSQMDKEKLPPKKNQPFGVTVFEKKKKYQKTLAT